MIRYATINDYEELRADKHISAEELTRAIDGNRILVFDDGGIAAWLRYNLFWDNTPFCNMLFVQANRRNEKIATVLVARWEQDMQNAGYTVVMTQAHANESGLTFWRKTGYADCGQFRPVGEDTEIIMHKKLS